MSKKTASTPVVQKPFRCPGDLDTEINRIKGALMFKTGLRISDNKFLIELIELGLKSIKQKNQIDLP